MNYRASLTTYIIFSMVGALMLLLASLLSPQETHAPQPMDKLIVGGIFISACFLGMSFATKPNWVKKNAQQNDNRIDNTQGQKRGRLFRGHHPGCERFSNHTIGKGKKVRCAGCIGLLSGSITSMILMFLFLGFADDMSYKVYLMIILIGLVLITLNFVETVNQKRDVSVHVTSNFLLVVGFFFVVTGIFYSTGSAAFGFAAVLISALWMDTRIHLSNWRHRSICMMCNKACKAF